MVQHPHILLANWRKFGLFMLLAFFIWQLGAPQARATTWDICQAGGCDFSDIQTAVNDPQVKNNDILTFPTNREIYAPFTVTNKTLTIQGNNTIIDATSMGVSAVTINNGSETVTISNFTVQGGSSSIGAGILLDSGNLVLTSSTVISNTASSSGGALYVASSGSVVTLTSVNMESNTAGANGGAIYNNGTINAQTLTLADNDATDGAGLYNNGTATVETLSTIQRNEASNDGGGVFNTLNGNLTLNNDDVSTNLAVNGAAVFNEGILNTNGTDFGSGNVASQTGGGLYNSGTATLVNSAVVQNEGATGAGIYNSGTLTATNSTLSRNDGANGAGLYNNGGTATLNNVTIHLTIGTSLFANNGTVTVGNSILSSVSGQVTCGKSGSGALQSNGYNLAKDQSCTFLTAAGDLQGLDPGLIGINSPAGGAAYHAPKLTSPVIDAGNPAEIGSNSTACLAADQRGLARPQSNRCDIGAVEIVVYRQFVSIVLK
ncbi:MAG: hypothetical protein H6655_07425 [Ardenticatenaceae bacterium]|nr:hypothetical protein [Ardenticatenaceae bacterium]